MGKACLLGFLLAGSLGGGCANRTGETGATTASATGTIKAEPNPVPAGSGTGKTQISWETGDGKDGVVKVSTDGKPEELFAEGPKGSKEAPWIGNGATYEFRLYSKTETSTPIATVKVVRATSDTK